MLKITPLSSLVFVVGIAAAGFACSSGGVEDTTVILTPTAGTAAAMGGSGNSGGTGTAPTAGTSPTTGGSDTGQAGSQTAAGSGGMVGTMGGMGGMGGGSTAGTGTGGSTGGTGTGGGSGGSGGASDAGKIMIGFADWYARNGGPNSSNPWTNNGDGTMTVKSGGGDIITKMAFSNVTVHVEYRTPKIDVSPADPQQRGNSGVYLKGSYEFQVLDTFGFDVKNDYCGAIYKVAAPLVSACKMAGEWNTIDIEFTANVCTNGTKTANAKFVQAKMNDMLVHQNVSAGMTTQGGLDETCNPRGLMLQDHGTVVPVSFRNIWIIPRP